MTDTNIKNLPSDREYFTEIGYSQQYPWAVVRRTAKTVTLAPVVVEADPEYKPDFHPGGFVGHVSNQSDQTWLFCKVATGREVTIRQTKKGWANQGVRFIENRAKYFYDYNF